MEKCGPGGFVKRGFLLTWMGSTIGTGLSGGALRYDS